jgi:integrase
MASLTWDGAKGGKTARIQFVIGDRRSAVRLGRVPVKVATTWVFRIEQLVANQVGGVAHDADLAAWLRDLPEDAHRKLSHVGLVAEREVAAAVTLGALCDAFTARAVVKPSTAKSYRQTLDSLLAFYGVEKPIAEITAESADEWRAWIATDREGKSSRTTKRTTVDNRLAPATVAKRVHVARCLFGRAVRWEWLTKNPFGILRAGSQANPARSHYVGLEVMNNVLESCPSVEWKLVVALCRLAGLRCPSEVGALTWADVDWQNDGRLIVRSGKTEGHGADHAVRVVPIVPILREILADAFERAEPGESRVVPMAGKRGAEANLRTTLTKLVTRAGYKPWPRLFQNLRSSCVTDWVQRYPAHEAAAWAGHSPAVASRHYLMGRDHHFADAVAGGLQGGAYSGALEAQKAAQHATAGDRIPSQSGSRNDTIPEENVVFPEDREVLNKRIVGDIGLERTGFPPGNTAFSDPGGAESGALPADLARLIEAWGSLTADDRRRIRAIIDGRLA